METKSKQIVRKQGLTALELALSHTFKDNPLARIKEKARKDPNCVLTSLAHLLTPKLLKESFEKLKKKAAVGVDGVSYADYENNLQENIKELHQNLKDRSYQASPLKRVWIDKGNGKKRPLGIAIIEDKIVQRAVTTLLNLIYEQDFYDFSYGFREKRKAHQALSYFRGQSMRYKMKWFINACLYQLKSDPWY